MSKVDFDYPFKSLIHLHLNTNLNNMERKDFLKSGLIIGTGSIIGSTNGFSQNLTTNEIDKLVDANEI
jgi:hypothetical protein